MYRSEGTKEQNMLQPSENQPRRRAERKDTPAFILNQIGKYALVKAESTKKGEELEIITALLMCALSMEAVLNHVGGHIFCDEAQEPLLWSAIERLSPRDKLNVMTERCNLHLDLGVRPFQDFRFMFKFRDDVVHPKPMKFAADYIQENICNVDEPPDMPDLQAWWERQCDIATVKKWRESVEKMSDELCKAAHCLNPLHISNFRVW